VGVDVITSQQKAQRGPQKSRSAHAGAARKANKWKSPFPQNFSDQEAKSNMPSSPFSTFTSVTDFWSDNKTELETSFCLYIEHSSATN
jgi:hypothetical protein